MGWVKGIREVKYVQVPIDEDRHGPIAHRSQRTVIDLPSYALGGTIQRGPLVLLPVHTGAGPCGTFAWAPWRQRMIDPNKLLGQRFQTGDEMLPMRSLSPLAWSVQHLVEPVSAWYAERNRPRDPQSRAGRPHGARSGGGNGRVALW